MAYSESSFLKKLRSFSDHDFEEIRNQTEISRKQGQQRAQQLSAIGENKVKQEQEAMLPYYEALKNQQSMNQGGTQPSIPYNSNKPTPPSLFKYMNNAAESIVKGSMAKGAIYSNNAADFGFIDKYGLSTPAGDPLGLIKPKTKDDENIMQARDALALKLYQESVQSQAKATEGLSGGWKVAGEAGIGLVKMLPNIAANVIMPGSGAVLSGAGLGADKQLSLMSKGTDRNEAQLRGAITNGIETGINLSPIGTFGRLNKIMKTDPSSANRIIAQIANGAWGEATEEGVSYIANYIADKAFNDPDANFDQDEMIKQMQMGALMGGLYDIAGIGVNKIKNKFTPNNSITANFNENVVTDHQDANVTVKPMSDSILPYNENTGNRETDLLAAAKNSNMQNEITNIQDSNFKNIVNDSVSNISDTTLKNNAIKVLNSLKNKIFRNGKILSFREQLMDDSVISNNEQPYLVKTTLENLPIRVLNDKPVVISQKIIDKALNIHGLPLELLADLDVMLQNPTEIIQTERIKDGKPVEAYMLFFDQYDKKNDKIQAVIYPNSKYGSQELIVDSIASVYGRNLENDIKNAIENNKVVWQQKNGQPSIGLQLSKDVMAVSGNQPSIGLQLPKDVMDTSTYNIPNDNTDVKSNLKNAKTMKLQDSERRSLTQLSKNLQDTFGISRSDVNNELKNEILKLKESLQTTGKIDSKAADALFKKAWELGKTKDTAMYDLYPELVTNLKEAGLDIEMARRALGKTAYNDFRYEAKKLVGMQKDGRSIDSFYNELANTYPELFDETINNEADQLYAMLDIADELQPRNKSLRDTDANLYKEGYREDFHKALNDYLSKMERFQKIHGENISKNVQKEPADYEVYKATMDQMKGLGRDYNRVMNEPFTQKEKTYADLISKGQLEYKDIKNANVDNVRKIVEAKQPLDQARAVKKDYKKAIRQERINTAKEFIKSMTLWKEKKVPFFYSAETAERNIIDVVGNNDEAKAMIDHYITPIHLAEAEASKFKNEYRTRIKNLNLTNKESEVVQRYGDPAGDMTAADVVNAGYDLDRIQHAVNEFRTVYTELISKVNEVLVKNGYNPIEVRKDYFPHFVEQENGVLETLKRILNPKNDLDNLGTSLAGITETFKPGKQFFANALQRHSDKTVFDAVRGFDNYIEGVSNVIFHTDNIQNLRALEETIRYQNSDEGLKAQIDEINNDGELSEDERQSKISELFRDREITGKFGGFVTWLNRYTNDLAGKKSVEDRTWEYNMGRGMYRLSKDLSNRVAGNMVAVNPSSWVTNFIPIAQATGECSSQNISKAMYDVVNSKALSDNFNSRSAFMTNRLGSENLYKTDMQKIVDKLSKGMQIIDNFTSEVVTRAKYYQNIENGMSDTEAMKNADAYAAGLIADRSKGAMPILFNVKNPITKAFTQFQLEQNNQLRYLFKDLPRAKQDEAIKALLIALFNIAVSSWLFNTGYEFLFGRRPALDPIDMAFDAWGVLNDSELRNSEKATMILSDVGGELPFIGNITGGGRLPIAGAIPKNPEKLLDLLNPEIDDRKKLDILYNQAIKPASYWMLPFGAGQLNKTMSGLHDYAQGAAYQYTDDGDKLKYTIDQNPLNLARAFIGGSSSFPEAQNYWDGDNKALSVKDTDTFQVLKDDLGNKTALEKVYELKAIESLKNANGGTIKYSKAILTRDYIDGLPLSDAEKQDLYDKYIVNEDIRNADSAVYKIYREKFEKELEGKK